MLYIFFVSISLMGASFKFFGKDFAKHLLETTANPFVGLFIGMLATGLVQSSSTTTSMTVALVAGGGLDVTRAIPIIIGANIGTSVTNTLVSLGHIGRPDEFRRAFAAATVHDFFNLLAVLVIFPLQLWTNFLGRWASFLGETFADVGGFALFNPLKTIVTPSVEFLTRLAHENGTIMLIIAAILLFVALRYVVKNLKALVIGKVELFFTSTLFRSAGRSFLLGLVLTVMVQSSSITTSLAVPLAGAGILTLVQIFPMTLGANVGTTITAILAALVTGQVAAITVAFAHLLFNITGIILLWPIKWVPLRLAETLAKTAVKSRLIPVVYILAVFFAVPLIFIWIVG
ncbi:MAG: Na/Pi symporter [Candidatus Krumholzibacteria bacterium]|nr:Na/Pi symporter [Candidatus Krumholzibacteria bacterium]